MALWNFLNAGPYAAGIFNFSHKFHCSSSKLCDNIGYNGKSKCLLEYCNDKLASSTWDNIFYLQLFKTFLCTGSSVQAECQGPWASCLSSLTWEYMAKFCSRRYSWYKWPPNYFKPFMIFCLNSLHKVTFWDFWMFVFSNFMKRSNLTWESMGKS